MTERQVRYEAAKVCKRYGFSYWFCPNHKFSTDIFGAFDMIIIPDDGTPYFIQLTTFSHKETRRRKIVAKFKGRTLPTRSYIWAYLDYRKTFIEIPIKK